MVDKLRLKKYPNRRLYDTEKSAYVTLGQVAEMIKQGREVEVRDAETKEDVTAFILTQIILEEARKKTFLLPDTFLYLIIRYGENVLSEFFDKYLEQTLKNYLSYKAAMDEQFRQWLEVGKDFSTMAGLPPFQSFWDFFSKAAKPEPEGEKGD
jgi:polyhydroxyalkanoate synthesis repressor PhaR